MDPVWHGHCSTTWQDRDGREGGPAMCEVCGDPMHKLDDDTERATTQGPVSTVTTPNGDDHPKS